MIYDPVLGFFVLLCGLALTVWSRWGNRWLLTALGVVWAVVGLVMLAPTLWDHLVAFAAFLESVRYQ